MPFAANAGMLKEVSLLMAPLTRETCDCDALAGDESVVVLYDLEPTELRVGAIPVWR